MEDTRALLLTDLVDSTRRNDELGDAVMAAWWQAHDRVARTLMATWNGTEVGRSDGFLVLFDSAREAVGYALAYHRSLADLEPVLEARVGIHVGPVTLRTNSEDDRRRGATPFEVDGVALPVAARVMSAATGRQTLLSGTARLAMGHDTTTTVRSHGQWRLKGLATPISLFEVGEPSSAPFAPPPDSAKAYRVVLDGDDGWRPARELPHNLPAERDGFVGRRESLLTLAARFDAGARLVSLLGIGGIGKTRLALRYARLWLGDHPGGAWFCDLAAARTAEGIVHAVAQGLEVQLGTADPVRQLGAAIAGRGPCLVVLDNFEQVVSHAGATLGVWLDRAPEAHFVVTSRERLGLPGEQLVDMEPLGATAARSLFAARAAAVAPGVAFSADDEEAVAPLLRLLDHLPLAIELAAARARVMSPAAMLQRIGERFRLLTERSGRIKRQASMQATLDWSWELLTADEQAALMQLSVFEGGFDADAAEAVVLLPEGASGFAVLDVVASLVDKSLVRSARDHRFALLETVRDYALGWRSARVAATSGSAALASNALTVRHWRYFGTMSEARAAAHRCADLDNLVAACRGATAAGAGAGATDALVNTWAALRLVGPYRAAVALADSVLTLPGLTPEQSGIGHAVAAAASNILGDATAVELHTSAGLELLQGKSPTIAVGRLHLVEGLHRTLAGELAAADTSLHQALAIAAQLADDWLKADVLTALGRLHDHQAQIPEARRCYDGALALARQLGDRRLEGGLLGNLGGLLLDLGRLEEAREHYERSLSACEAVGDRQWSGNACSNLGLVLLDLGRPDEARRYLDRALATAEACGNVRLAYTVRCNLGIVLTAGGELAAAEAQLRRAVEAAASAGDRRAEGQFLGYLGLALARLGRAVEGRACLARGEEYLNALGDRLSLALLLCDRAEVALSAGDEAAAIAARAAASAIADQLQCEPASELSRRLEAVAALGGGEFGQQVRR